MSSSAPSISSARDVVFLARQPILDRSGHVRAYELLCRNGEVETAGDATPDEATARVLHGAVMNVGLEALVPGCPGFINVTKALLLGDIDLLLPPANIVLEIVETIEIDDQVVEACRRLQAKRYALALDDFVPGSPAERLFPFVSYVKVDVLAVDEASRRRVVKSVPKHVHLIAEKVETAEMFEATAQEGFELFQGYYCRPSTLQSTEMSTQQTTSLRLLEALNRPRVTVGELDDLIRRDASLCHRVLRYVNSAALGLSRPVHSIRQAITLIGLDPIRKWSSIWSLAGLNQARTPEVMRMAVVRARCCERFGGSVVGRDAGGELFLLGLCSLLDVLLDRPMRQVLQGVFLADPTTRALLGEGNTERHLLDAVVAYERGDWEDASAACWKIGRRTVELAAAFTEATEWAQALER